VNNLFGFDDGEFSGAELDYIHAWIAGDNFNRDHYPYTSYFDRLRDAVSVKAGRPIDANKLWWAVSNKQKSERLRGRNRNRVETEREDEKIRDWHDLMILDGLWRKVQAVRKGREHLPYTKTFEGLFIDFCRLTGKTPHRHNVWSAVCYLDKRTLSKKAENDRDWDAWSNGT
jgi:hypothetical protein